MLPSHAVTVADRIEDSRKWTRMQHSDLKKLKPIQSLVRDELEALEKRLAGLLTSDIPLI